MEKVADKQSIKIAIIGAESTGKTTLSQQLADHFSGIWVPEYARNYVASLGRPYRYQDVLHIASVQKKEYSKEYNARIVFFDTDLIITKVWFEVCWKGSPSWVVDEIINSKFDGYLLCDTQIPWQPDDVRENGGEMRETLHHVYLKNLNDYHKNYQIVTGLGNERFDNAVKHINSIISATERRI
jgi:NadR type nicotinamide-nucleotide adenylyltransferase